MFPTVDASEIRLINQLVLGKYPHEIHDGFGCFRK